MAVGRTKAGRLKKGYTIKGGRTVKAKAARKGTRKRRRSAGGWSW